MIDLIDKAIAFALTAHEGQKRRLGGLPYIAHPVAVAMILQGMGCAETVVAAALLHDTVEDTPVTLAQLQQEFGPEVAGMVALITEPEGTWEERKAYLIQSLRQAPLEVKLLAAADKYHNVHHTLRAREKEGQATWRAFHRGAEQQAWFYRAVYASLVSNVPDPARYPLFARLEEAIQALFAGIPSHPPQPAPGRRATTLLNSSSSDQ